MENYKGLYVDYLNFFKETIITTNYDDLLKQIYADQDIHFDQVLFGIDAEEFKKLFGEGYRILLKLYGSFISKNKRVLTQDDYPKTLF